MLFRSKSVESSDGKLVEIEKEISPGEKVKVTGIQYAPGKVMSPDAGWNYNVGKAAWSPDLNKYDNSLANSYIKQTVNSKEFEKFFGGQTDKEWVEIGVVSPVVETIIKKEMKADTKVVLLSGDTIDLHKERKEVGLEQYRNLPEIIYDPGTIIKEDDNHMLFYSSGGLVYEVVIKVTGDKKEMFVKTIHRGRIRKNLGKIIYEKKK